MRPHRWQPTRLPRPWDSPGRNTGAGCHFLLQCRKVKSESEVAQSCMTLSDPTDCRLPGSSVHGIFQAQVLEWGCHCTTYYLIISVIHHIWLPKKFQSRSQKQLWLCKYQGRNMVSILWCSGLGISKAVQILIHLVQGAVVISCISNELLWWPWYPAPFKRIPHIATDAPSLHFKFFHHILI